MPIHFENEIRLGKSGVYLTKASAPTCVPVTNVSVPVLSGVVAVGETLTCSTGTWNGSAPITYPLYVWFDQSLNTLQSGSSNTYVIVSGDVGKQIFCRVFPLNPCTIGGSVYADSDLTIVVPYPYSIEYQAVLDYATSLGYTLPSNSQKIKQDNLVIALKNANIWQHLDTFGMFATDGSSDFALIDWVRLTTYTAVNSPTFVANAGFNGNGTSSYINTNFNISNGNHYKKDKASINFWVENISTLASALVGLPSGTQVSLTYFNNTGQRINSTNSASTSLAMNVVGWKGFNRLDGTNIRLYNRTSQMDIYNATQTSTALVSLNALIFRQNTTYGSRRLKFFSMGKDFDVENLDYYNAINDYFNSL